MAKARILAFAGSARKDSFNKKLIQLAARDAESAGAQVTLIDLADYPLPLYDGDLEAQGQPANARKLREIFLEHDALMIAAPEYNSSITPLLKNTIDWVSRNENGQGEISPYKGKVALLLSASPGALGGLRGLVHLRAILGNIGVLVLPNQRCIGVAHEAFDESGALKDAKAAQLLKGAVQELVETTGKIAG
jgi:chromate reductase